jgi:hypothetical protein
MQLLYWFFIALSFKFVLLYFIRLNPMTPIRLVVCCYLTALSYNALAQGVRANENKMDERIDAPIHRQEKMAGRANNDAHNKNPSAQYPLYSQEAHEKKPLSKEEKRALRRQINETEIKYPRK